MKIHNWFHGVMVSTQGSESCDPSSNLGENWKLSNTKKYMKLFGPMRYNELNNVFFNYNYLVEWMSRIRFLLINTA